MEQDGQVTVTCQRCRTISADKLHSACDAAVRHPCSNCYDLGRDCNVPKQFQPHRTLDPQSQANYEDQQQFQRSQSNLRRAPRSSNFTERRHQPRYNNAEVPNARMMGPFGAPVMAPFGAPTMAPFNPMMAPFNPTMAPFNPMMAPFHQMMFSFNPLMASAYFMPPVRQPAVYVHEGQLVQYRTPNPSQYPHGSNRGSVDNAVSQRPALGQDFDGNEQILEQQQGADRQHRERQHREQQASLGVLAEQRNLDGIPTEGGQQVALSTPAHDAEYRAGGHRCDNASGINAYHAFGQEGDLKGIERGTGVGSGEPADWDAGV